MYYSATFIIIHEWKLYYFCLVTEKLKIKDSNLDFYYNPIAGSNYVRTFSHRKPKHRSLGGLKDSSTSFISLYETIAARKRQNNNTVRDEFCAIYVDRVKVVDGKIDLSHADLPVDIEGTSVCHS